MVPMHRSHRRDTATCSATARKRTGRLLGLLFGSLALAACSEPPVTSIVTAPLVLPIGGKVTNTSLGVPAGRALAFVAQPMNGEETLKQDITLPSADDSVAEVLGTEKMNQFVLVGHSAGHTTLTVTNEAGQPTSIIIDVEVTAP